MAKQAWRVMMLTALNYELFRISVAILSELPLAVGVSGCYALRLLKVLIFCD
jgi:hypothetical protein